MASNIFTHQFRHGGKDYRFTLQMDDGSVSLRSLTFPVAAEYKNSDASSWKKITILLEVIPGEDLIVVWVESTKIGEIKLTKAAATLEERGSAEDDGGKPIDFEKESADFGAIVEQDPEFSNSFSTAVEELIQGIPVDPVFGCFIKGAASTAIGHITRCWIANRNDDDIMVLFGHMKECLSGKVATMVRGFVWRCAKCVFTGGLF